MSGNFDPPRRSEECSEKDSVLISRPASPRTGDDLRAYEDVMHCNRCGLCTSHCPTYLATGNEGMSPRGRNQLWRALMEGRIDPGAGRSAFDTCLQCGICTSVCFAEVPTASLMSRAKEKVDAQKGGGFLKRFILRVLLPRPIVMEGCLKWLYGIILAGRKLGIKNAKVESILGQPPKKFLRDILPRAATDARVIYFLACGPNCVMPEVGVATSHLLKVRGIVHGTADTVCCGLPGLSFGDREAARRLAQKNIKILESFPEAVILVDDSSCAATVKEWPALFEMGDPWRARAEGVSRRARDLMEWLDKNPGPAWEGPKTTVTYHDACKARYAQGLAAEPRRLLAGLEGVEARELPESEQCCGGGGMFQVTHPEISKVVGNRKKDNILSVSSDWVLTSSVSCLVQLRSALNRAGARVRVAHIAVFLALGNKESSKRDRRHFPS